MPMIPIVKINVAMRAVGCRVQGRHAAPRPRSDSRLSLQCAPFFSNDSAKEGLETNCEVDEDR
jgi:hypothetical protein